MTNPKPITNPKFDDQIPHLNIQIIDHHSSFIDDHLAAADEVDDFDLVAVADDHLREPVTLDDGEVVLDGHAPGVDVELFQQGDQGQRLLDLERFAVEGDLHGSSSRVLDAV